MAAIPSATKHKLEGIGEASASAIIAAWAANPSTAWLASGIAAKLSFFFLSHIFSGLASIGLVVLNVGAENLATALAKANYDGSWESAEAMIKAIRDSGNELTEADIRRIDATVIVAFRRFGKIGRKK